MKKIFILFLAFYSLNVFCQAPSLISYQGLLRNAQGVPLPNKNFSLRFELRQGSPGALAVFTETQTIVTNSLGLFSTHIGASNPQALDAINMEGGTLYLQVAVDTTSQGNFMNAGNPQQLISVPFSMHSKDVSSSYDPGSNQLKVGKKTYTLAGAVQQTVDIQPGNSNITVSGSYPNYTVSGTPSLSINGNSISISGGNTVTFVPSGTVITAPSTSITLSGVGTISSSGTNTFDINIPATTLTGIGGVTVTGTYPTFTIDAPSLLAGQVTTLSGSGAALVSTLGVNAYSVHVFPVQVALTSTVGPPAVSSLGTNSFNINIPPSSPQTSVSVTSTVGAVGISSAGTNSFNINIPATQPQTSVSVTSTAGVVGISSAGTNSFNINIPPAQPQTSVSVTSTAGIVGVSSAGTNTFNINIPPVQPQTTLTSSGAAIISSAGTNSFNVSVPQTSVSVTSTAGVVGISSAGTNTFNINIPPAQPQTSVSVTSTAGVVGISSAGTNTFNINIPPAAPQTSVTVTSSVGPVGISTSGTNTFNINVPPVMPQTTLTGNGAITVGSAGTNSFNVTVPQTSVSVTSSVGAAGISSSGTNTFNINIPPSLPQTTLIPGGAVNVSSAGTNTFNVTVPGTSVSVTSSVGPVGVSSVGTNTFNINVPPSLPQTTLSAGGAVMVTSPGTNSFNVSVPQTSVSLTSTTGLAGISSAGTNSFNINVPPPVIPTIVGQGLAVVNASGSNYTVNVPTLTYTPSNGELVSGTNTVVVMPALSFSDAVLSSGAITNSLSLNTGTDAVWSTNGNWGTNSTVNFIGTNDPEHLVFKTNAVDRMTILNNGRVGIGTSTPSADLQVQNLFSDVNISLTSSSLQNAGLSFGTTSNQFLGNIRYNLSNNSMNFWTNNTPNRLFIDNVGNIGVGHTAPIAKLDIFSSGSDFLTMTAPALSSHINVNANPGSSGNLRILSNGGPSNGISFHTNSSQRLIITGNGNVGVGTSAPTSTFQVNGTSRFVDGTEGAGKVLTSDNLGNASWQAATNFITASVFCDVINTVTPLPQKFANDLITFTKSANSKLEITFHMDMMVADLVGGIGVMFELRLSGSSPLPATNTGRTTYRRDNNTVWSLDNAIPATLVGIFNNVPAGSYNVELWAWSISGGNAYTAGFDPGCIGSSYVIVKEFR